MTNDSVSTYLDKLLDEACSKFHKMRLKQFASIGITSHQSAILLLLDEKGPTKVGDISMYLGMVNSNVSNICTRLDKLGLIERRRPKENQRTVEICLTERAIGEMEGIKQSMSDIRIQMFNEIKQEDIEHIILGLQKLNKLFDLQMKNSTKQGNI
ncbi:MAG: MarR family transcriptional regulator [Eubacteriales bacterium]|nr:MarR family transcriptional regulator [Eubacteriales bacterium]MDD4390745.1 MarR family transcriptional regulator [Eubacteriales bacterium]